MISSQWQMPDQKVSTLDHPPLPEPNISVSGINIPQDVKDALNSILNKISKEIMQNTQQQLPLVYDSKGDIPFPKDTQPTIDLGSHINSFKANSFSAHDNQKIEQLLSKYGITCPGAESVEIQKDSSDPFLTTIIIKKSFF